jgi:general L-amino acid transport system permease protein
VKPDTPPQVESSSTDNEKVKFWNDPGKRALLFQILMVLAVVAFLYYIIHNAVTNMQARHIKTGFAFLHEQAGFGIIQSLIPYSEMDSYGRTFIVGLLNTLLVSVLGIIFATILGFIVGVARLSTNWLVAKVAAVYIEIFRNTPLLLQIFFWYFAVLRSLPSPRQSLSFENTFFLNIRGLYIPDPLPQSGFGWVWAAILVSIVAIVLLKRYSHITQRDTGRFIPVLWPAIAIIIILPTIVYFLAGSPLHWDLPALHGFNFSGGITILPELLALLLALTVYTAAFIGEIVRSGILAVPHGQTEASQALGLSSNQRLRLVVIPQAMRVIIPPLTSQFLNLIKNSSLATAIGYPDLVSVFAGTTLNQAGQAIEIIFMTMSVYLVFSLITSFFMNWFNKRVALVER